MTRAEQIGKWVSAALRFFFAWTFKQGPSEGSSTSPAMGGLTSHSFVSELSLFAFELVSGMCSGP